MRIVAGTHRSRKLETLEGDNTRPTMDKVKEAVFSVLGGYFDEGSVLDPFAGSGSIGLEAISRGMTHAVLADNSYEAVQVIKRNIAMLHEEQKCDVWKMDYKKTLARCHETNQQFDLVYLDPPYAKAPQWISDCIQRMDALHLIKEDGIIVAEYLTKDDINYESTSFVPYKEATYGIMKVVYLRRA